MKNKALVVIDIQNDITKNYKEIIENINKAVDWAVVSDIPVVYIKHNNLSAGTRTFKPDTHGAELVPDLKIVSEHVFLKTKGNALTSEGFAAFVSENEIGEFYISGADAIACVKSTCYNMTKAISFTSCLTVSPVTIKEKSMRCFSTMRAKGVLSRN